MSDSRERARGAFYGLALGDALGMPTQQMPRSFVATRYGAIDGFHAGPAENSISAGMAPGTITDDTEQALLLAETLIEGAGRVDPLVLAEKLREWEKIASARGGEQLGPSTRRALDALAAGVAASDAGRRGDTNGAAMRIAPVGIAVAAEPLGRLVDAVEDASALTHNTGLAISGAAAVAAAVSTGVAGGSVDEAVGAALRAAEIGAQRGHFAAGANICRRMRFAIDLAAGEPDNDTFFDELDRLVGTSVATQESVPAVFALVVRDHDDPWRACCIAASLGGDSDTVGAMVGAVLGACNGFDRLPGAEVATIARVNKLDLDPIVDALLALRDDER